MIKITQAKLEDLDTIKFLMLSALQSDPTAFTVSYNEYAIGSNAWWQNYLSAYLESSAGKMYLAKIDGKTAGMVGVLFNRRERQKHVANIVWFYVIPEFRSKGLGRELMNFIMNDIGNNKDIKKLSLTVTEKQTAAINLYKKLGFDIAGTQKKELRIADEYLDFLIMEKEII